MKDALTTIGILFGCFLLFALIVFGIVSELSKAYVWIKWAFA